MGCGASRPPAAPTADVSATPFSDGSSPPVEKESSSSVLEYNNELAGTTLVKAWVANTDGILSFPEIDDPDFAIPSLDQKTQLAVCISGGGFRAATLGLGWLRALHVLGILKRAKYLCACSGSSWLSAALCFQEASEVEEFLGPYLPPQDCTLQALKEVGDKGHSMAAALADAEPVYDFAKGLFSGLFDGDSGKEARAWSKAMTAAFLTPFGLGEVDNSTVSCAGTKGNVQATVIERASAVGRDTVYTASSQDLPFPIICQVIMLPKDKKEDSGEDKDPALDRAVYYPFEWTPLYGGCPVLYTKTEPPLGGGWVETLGLNSERLGEPPAGPVSPGGGLSVRVKPSGPASLGEAIGISSAYNSYKLALGKNALGVSAHKALGFNTAQYFNQQDWTTRELQFTDGGGVDLHAIYPALRRRVPCIIALAGTRTSVHDEDLQNFSKYMKDLAALFGCWPGDPKDTTNLPAPELNQQRQVFSSDGFADLHAGLVDRIRAGQPPAHVGEYEVLDCPALGIRGGWRVRVLWVINDKQPAWEAALPDDTRDKLEGDRNDLSSKIAEAANPLDADTFKEFPFVSTFAMNYTPELVNLMANHAAFMLVGSRELMEDMLAAAEAEAQ